VEFKLSMIFRRHEIASLLACFNVAVDLQGCLPKNNLRGIEWSLRALASMRAVRLFLRARAVIKYVLRAASTKKYGCRVVSKLSRRNLDFSLLKRNSVMRQAVWLTPLNQSQSLPTATCALLAMMSNYVR